MLQAMPDAVYQETAYETAPVTITRLQMSMTLLIALLLHGGIAMWLALPTPAPVLPAKPSPPLLHVSLLAAVAETTTAPPAVVSPPVVKPTIKPPPKRVIPPKPKPKPKIKPKPKQKKPIIQ
ncbi:MAG: hypothetical protein GXP10_09260, partial [Gammaproteobacteria bacterium]|nr:hypothetical protein [Gammaproteobacteria bacterium]